MRDTQKVSEVTTASEDKGRELAAKVISQREFLKTLAGALGLAGASLLATGSNKAEAT